MRQHLKAVDEFVCHLYPSIRAERYVHGTFERARQRPPSGTEREIRLHLFAEARALVRRQQRRSWVHHNARVARERLLAAGEVLTGWHAWAEVQRLVTSMEYLTPQAQEILQIVSLYEGFGSAELATILRVSPVVAERLLDEALADLRDAFTGGDPAARVGGMDR